MPKQMDGVAFGVQLANLDLPHDIEFPFVSPGAARRHGRRDQRRLQCHSAGRRHAGSDGSLVANFPQDHRQYSINHRM